jgi:hypothetical protein
VIPVGFVWTGEQFVIATATTAPKVAALSARPDVALAIDAGDTPEQARALSIRGRASVQIVDGVVPEYLAAAGDRSRFGDCDNLCVSVLLASRIAAAMSASAARRRR